MAAAMRGPLLELERISVRLDGRMVLDDFSLSVAPGERLVIAGPSGSGKSTLLRAVAGLLPIDSGEIRIDGKRIDKLPPAQREVAMMFQSHALLPHLSLLDNLTFGLRARGMARDTAEQRARLAADSLGLSPLLARRPAQLSGGERQRAALVRALLHQPKALLLDEPLSSLDAPLRAVARAEMLSAHRQSQAALLLVTHDQSEAMAMADRLGILHEGRLLQLASPRQLYARPANLFIARFLGEPAMNIFTVETTLGGGVIRRAEGKEQYWDGVLPPGAIAPCRPLVLGLRPEQLSLPGSRLLQPSQQLATLSATVERVEPQGEQQIVWLASAGQRLAARAEPELRVEPGATLPLRVALDGACWFDADTGAALPAAGAAG